MGEVTTHSVIGDSLDGLDLNGNGNDSFPSDIQSPFLLPPFCTSSSLMSHGGGGHHNNGADSASYNGIYNNSVIAPELELDGLSIQDVKYLTYGIIWPSICALGIVGNVLNLIVLNQPNMKGTAYIYMRGE